MTIQAIKFFKGKNLGPIIKTEGEWLVFVEDSIYRVQLLDQDQHFKHQLTKETIDGMRELLPAILPVEEVGLWGQYSYLIREKISDNKYDMGREDQEAYGRTFGRFLKAYHQQHQEADNKLWTYLYQDKILHFFHEHGLSQDQEVDDYLLIDYIRDNAYLINDRQATNILHLDSFHDLKISSEGIFEFQVSDHSHITDPYYEFRSLGLDYQGIQGFLYGLLAGYFDLVPRSFFRTTALYLLVDYWGETFLEEGISQADRQARKQELFRTYEDLGSFQPRWYKDWSHEV